jgi:septal ring factor EnvC (AmiA/AmiB activator)
MINIDALVEATADDLAEVFTRIHKDGFKAGAESRPVSNEEQLKQIDRMARQIEECHSTIRRRNQQIKDLESDIRTLSAPTSCCCENEEC